MHGSAADGARSCRDECAFGAHHVANGKYGDSVADDASNFGGMTVNERLFVAGLLGEWDAAIDIADRSSAIEILTRVDLSEDGAAWTVDAVLANPAKYGFPREK